MTDDPHPLQREVTVLAVDDQESFRGTLRELVAAAEGFVLVGEASTGDEAIHAADDLEPALVLMDVHLPGMDGISASRAILNRHPQTVLVLISVDDPGREPGVSLLGEAVSSVCKQDLCPRTLREVWETARD